MLANNNLNVCRKLIRRDLSFHKAGNFVLILAAALVTGLYSFVFLLGSAVEGAFLLSYQYSYGSTSHILYTGLTEHQADLISGNADVKSAVRLSSIGQLSSPQIGQRSVKLAVTDRAYAETILCLPGTGHLPQKADEIAMDEYTMDSLGIRHELGAPVRIRWTDTDGKAHDSSFVLCGWWESSANFTESCAWITKEAAAQLSPGYEDEDAENITLGVTLYLPRDLEAQAAQILADQGISGVSFSTSLAWNEARREQAVGQALPYYAPAILVLLCGFLMISGIVHVETDRNMLFFAGLKAQGMTPRQIRHFLLEKGCAVTLFSLIPGWLAGFALDFFITGKLISGMRVHPALFFLDWPPFLLAGLCSLGTVLLSFLLPMNRLAGCLPARLFREAKRSYGRGTPDGYLSLFRLARRILRQHFRRILLSAGIVLSAALFLSAQWLRYIGMKEQIYLSSLSPWDYSITDGSAALSIQIYNQDSLALTEADAQELRDRPEVTSVSVLKTRELPLTASETLRKRLSDFYSQPYDETRLLRDTQAAFPEWGEGLRRLERTGEYTALVIGLEGDYLDFLLEYSPFTSGSFDAEAFSSGRFVIAGGAYHEGISSPMASETVTLAGSSFPVMGSVMNDDSYINGSNSPDAAFSIAYILPLSAFDALFPGQGIRQLAVDIDPSDQASFEAWLNEWEQGLDYGAGIIRRSDYQEHFEAARLNMVLPQLIVGVVLLGTALLNFGNLLTAWCVSRRREFAVYESLGMTGGQLRRLLLLEGVLCFLLTALIVAPCVVLFSRFVMPAVVAADTWASSYTFSLAPLYLLLLILLLFSTGVPLLCLHLLRRGSIRERLCAFPGPASLSDGTSGNGHGRYL
ncbi:MAG TPA: ABC transporter permease [Candidatus Eisenbergiella intestinipullorum]|nr:ABC transporter permease [Candidatus Eisenbergiella intestinipullorum]